MAVLRRQTSGKRAPSLAPRLHIKKGVEGIRLPTSQRRLEEDDYCPNRCGGIMLVVDDGSYTLAISENSYLQCSSCGFEYRNTVEDNMIVDMVRSIFGQKEAVDIPDFSLYDIFGSAPKRRREMKEID